MEILPYSVYKVGGCCAPTLRNVVFSNLHLLLQYMVSYFLSRLAHVRPFAKHALVCHHPNGEIVHRNCVFLAAHDLRCHVARGAGSVRFIVLAPGACDPEISDT